MASRMFALVLVMFSYLFFPSIILSAPDPSEVEKMKAAAPMHVIATVSSDGLHKDLTADQFYQQVRKMELKLNQVLKGPESVGDHVEVYYSYIPSWQGDYAGGKRMDISVNDKIEIWLEEGEFGWEPVLGGNSVTHHFYTDQRSEPIQEPLFHKLNRIMNEAFEMHTGSIVFVSLLIFLSILLIKASKTWRIE